MKSAAIVLLGLLLFPSGPLDAARHGSAVCARSGPGPNAPERRRAGRQLVRPTATTPADLARVLDRAIKELTKVRTELEAQATASSTLRRRVRNTGAALIRAAGPMGARRPKPRP